MFIVLGALHKAHGSKAVMCFFPVHFSFADLSVPCCSRAQVMYYIIGKIIVLQPDAELTFVGGEGYHPMLPAGPGLFTLREPTPPPAPSIPPAASASTSVAPSPAGLTTTSTATAVEAGGKAVAADTQIAAAPKVANNALSFGSWRGRARVVEKFGPPPKSVKEAVFALMNFPHPLDILAEASSYGPHGGVRDHIKMLLLTVAVAVVCWSYLIRSLRLLANRVRLISADLSHAQPRELHQSDREYFRHVLHVCWKLYCNLART